MIVEARVAHPAKTFIIWLPLHGIFCQGVLLILQGEGILKDIDQHLVSCQTALAVEQKITKASIADFGQCTRFPDSSKSAIHIIWLKLLSCDPAEDFRWRMTAILTLLMVEVVE